uniref:Putative secreted protein n=1 Tax=Anopheles darlingi TaxID=43151 RepID=A0A2M4D468_ANODA
MLNVIPFDHIFLVSLSVSVALSRALFVSLSLSHSFVYHTSCCCSWFRPCAQWSCTRQSGWMVGWLAGVC